MARTKTIVKTVEVKQVKPKTPKGVQKIYETQEVLVIKTVFKEERTTVRSPEDAYDFLKPLLEELDRENFYTVALNTKNEIIAINKTFVGSLNASIVHPREVFKFALYEGAASIVVAHNHPSGNPLNIVS